MTCVQHAVFYMHNISSGPGTKAHATNRMSNAKYFLFLDTIEANGHR
jgi:hypothetical protein